MKYLRERLACEVFTVKEEIAKGEEYVVLESNDLRIILRETTKGELHFLSIMPIYKKERLRLR